MSDIDIDALQDWVGRSETSDAVLTPTPARALAATLDHEPASIEEGGILPPLYHWIYFPILTRASELAHDGHAKKGAFMPPVPFPRRMFAGARLDYHGSLRVGTRVTQVATIAAVEHKEGRSGPLVFVTVQYTLSDTDGIKIVEQQDIAYRPTTGARAPARTSTTERPAAYAREIVPDETLLFRYSALTFNGHRIHYDLPFAVAEGYPSLVVHGPLTATLLADLVVREAGTALLAHFSFRAKRAMFLGGRIRLRGKPNGAEIALTALDEDGNVCVEAKAVLA